MLILQLVLMAVTRVGSLATLSLNQLDGNPGGNAHIDGSFFFPELRTGGLGEPANSGFLGDFSAAGQITISFDVRVDSITDFIGNEIFRPFGVMLIDRDILGGSGPSGVFLKHSSWVPRSRTTGRHILSPSTILPLRICQLAGSGLVKRSRIPLSRSFPTVLRSRPFCPVLTNFD